jgi:hypothetical protein
VSWGDGPNLARELEDVREQQRAISVLRAVARSAGIQPVLDEVVEACERLCRADYSSLYLLERGLLHVVAHHTKTEGAAGMRRSGESGSKGATTTASSDR